MIQTKILSCFLAKEALNLSNLSDNTAKATYNRWRIQIDSDQIPIET